MIQHQKTGDNSTNIQAESITISCGLTYNDVKEIALDVFNTNFLRLSDESYRVALERNAEITEKFLIELEKQNPAGIHSAQDPDFQYTLFNLQNAYARCGDVELGDLLVNLLVDRTKQPNRSLLQIVLNESIIVAPKLTQVQLSALSIVFLTRYVINNRINNFATFFAYLNESFSPFVNYLVESASCYQHIEYTGCGSIGIGEVQFIDVLKTKYKGLFSKGFTMDDIKTAGLDYNNVAKYLNKCLHDQSKMQINALNEDMFKDSSKGIGLVENDIITLINLENSKLMSNDEIRNFIINNLPYMEIIMDVWSKSFMKNLTLTSVGIAIGHANVKRYDSDFTNLDIWIN